jgi:TAP42-like family
MEMQVLKHRASLTVDEHKRNE